jgi:hypothetical protein
MKRQLVVVPALRKKGQDLIPFLPHLDAPSLLVKTSFPAFSDAKGDFRAKVRPLSTMFYEELQFILGYIAAGSAFQWFSIGKRGLVRRVGPRLDLSIDVGCCKFLLSIGYTY